MFVLLFTPLLINALSLRDSSSTCSINGTNVHPQSQVANPHFYLPGSYGRILSFKLIQSANVNVSITYGMSGWNDDIYFINVKNTVDEFVIINAFYATEYAGKTSKKIIAKADDVLTQSLYDQGPTITIRTNPKFVNAEIIIENLNLSSFTGLCNNAAILKDNLVTCDRRCNLDPIWGPFISESQIEN